VESPSQEARLREQVRRIAQEHGGETRSVIIRVGGESREEDQLLQTAADVLRRRNLSLTARDCLPPDRKPKETVTQATPPPALEVRAEALQGSLLADAPDDVEVSEPRELRAEATDRLKPLLEHEHVQAATADREVDTAATPLWAATSLAVELPVGALERVVEELPGIAGVYPNRSLGIPPVVEAVNLPHEVRESRSASYGLRQVGALAAWGVYGARGQGVRVGVLDTGVDASHPDLAGKVKGWAEFDADGRPIAGSTPYDDNGHGTHVAGTIAGGNTSGQWIGVAPEADLYCARVLGPSGGSDTQVLAGIGWAIEQKVDVISMSLGGFVLAPEMPGTYTQSIVTALRAGIPVVIAIGNEGSQTSGSPGNDIFALAVGATDYLDRPAGFSGGRTQVVRESEFINPRVLPLPYSKPDVSAPGVAVVSAKPGGTWQALNGTSMATPHVAGAIAALLSVTTIRKNTQPHECGFLISDLITGSVKELGESGQDHRYGFGRIDVMNAIDFAKERGY
jgi:subtilisin family serine protease